MFSLKSELFKKQQEVTSKKSGQIVTSAIRKQHKLKSSSNGEGKVPENEKNPGVEERNARDIAETSEEIDKGKMVKSVLEAKAKLYEKMSSGNLLPDEESSSLFLVDFEQKSMDARLQKTNNELDIKPKVGVNVATELASELQKSENEWVEYTDSLGRTRACLKKDLDRMKRMDEKLNEEKRRKPEIQEPGERTLLSDDMRREIKREQWEKEAVEEINGPLHYEDLRAREIRELGVGYFAFSTDQETRDTQMKLLRKMRDETQKERENAKDAEKKKRTALQARLEKVRLGRIKKLKAQGKEIPEKLLKPIELSPPEAEEEKPTQSDVTIAEITKRDDGVRKEREWDKGKEWLPAEPTKPPKSWKDPHNERLDEFAPPSFYYDTTKDHKHNKNKRKYPQNNTHPINPLSTSYSDSLTHIRHGNSQSTSNRTDSASIKTEEKLGDQFGILNTLGQKTNFSSNSTATNPGISADIQERTDRVLDYLTSSSIKQENSGASSILGENNPDLGKKEPKMYENIVENDVNMFVPTDKPITMKIKQVPKKSKVLVSKSAFSDD
ncbi:coiled-coil domain-containing protein 174-like [Styela clava]